MIETIPLKRLIDPRRPITYGIVQAGEDVAGGVPYIRPVDMDGHRGVDVESLRTTSPEVAAAYSRSSLKPGDVVVSIGPSFGKTMVVPDELAGANLTQGTARVAVRAGVDARYVVWALQSQIAIDFWESSIGGATFRALNLGPLAETPICLSAAHEQRTVAAYLDRETARADALIEEQERLIEILHERRQAIISCTLRDDSNASIRLSRIASSRSGDVPPPLEEDGKYDVWGAGRLVGRVSHANARAGDLLVGRVGQGSVGKIRRLTKNAWATDNTIILGLDVSVAEPRYIEHGLRLIPRFELVGGGAMPLITAERLLAQYVPFTSLAAQRQVVEELDEQTAKIDLLVAESKRFVELARERRSALITAAVTGQIDVREMV